MSFRLKTILGVALIEALLLLVLVVSSVNHIRESNEDSLKKRANTIALSLANVAADAILATDLARLDAVAKQAMEAPDLAYVRFYRFDEIVAQAGAPEMLTREFVGDADFSQIADGIYDDFTELNESGTAYGRIELGLMTKSTERDITDFGRYLSGIALFEMFLVALFSYWLGSFLTRGLKRLRDGAGAVASGELGMQLQETGNDELGDALKSFNIMSAKVAEADQEVREALESKTTLSERLASEERKISAILNSATDGIIEFDGSMDVISMNRSAEDLFKVHNAGGSLLNLRDLLSDALCHEIDSIVSSAGHLGRTNRRNTFLGHGFRDNDEPVDLDVSISPLPQEAGGHFVGLFRDISERAKLERSARRNEKLRDEIVSSSLDALITIDSKGLINEFSPEAERIFGYARDEILGLTIVDHLIPEASRAAHRAGFDRCIATGEGPILGKLIEVEALRRDGHTFPAELTIQRIVIDDEVLFTAFMRDISKRKASETALIEAKTRAEEASRAKSRFLAHMSHEIRSPLNGVLGALQILLEDELLPEQRLYANTADAAGKTLSSLINDILDFSKIEAGEITLEHRNFDICDVVNEAIDSVAVKAREKDLPIAVVFESGLSRFIAGDALRIRQILTNLVDNAVKFTATGEIVVSLRAENSGDDQSLVIEVRDSGVGIPESALDTLFDEFQQVDSSDTTGYGGTGLGLAISRRLVRLMGGDLSVVSTLGEGSTFTAKIPFTPVGNATEDGKAKSSKRLKVGAIGFTASIRTALSQQCPSLGCEIVTFETASAVQVSTEKLFDAFLIDAKLGATVVRKAASAARRMHVETCLLVVSKVTDEVETLLNEGVCDEILMTPLIGVRIKQTLMSTMTRSTMHLEKTLQNLPAAQILPAPQTPSVGLRILVAEDSKTNQVVVRAMLERAGHNVSFVQDGARAVEACLASQYDVVLMDLRMPNKDGIQATKEIRQCPELRELPIIALTANAFKEDVERCLAVGMVDFVAKPIDREELLNKIAMHAKVGEVGVAPERRMTEEESSSPDATVIDEMAYRRLAADVTEKAMPEIMSLFVREIIQRSDRIESLLEAKDVENIEIEAHTLKGCAGSFGAAMLYSYAFAIERACREEPWPKIAFLCKKLPAAKAATLDALKARLDVEF